MAAVGWRSSATALQVGAGFEEEEEDFAGHREAWRGCARLASVAGIKYWLWD